MGESILTELVFIGAIIQGLFSDPCPLELIQESYVLSFQDKACKLDIILLINHKTEAMAKETFYFRKLASPLYFIQYYTSGPPKAL